LIAKKIEIAKKMCSNVATMIIYICVMETEIEADASIYRVG